MLFYYTRVAVAFLNATAPSTKTISEHAYIMARYNINAHPEAINPIPDIIVPISPVTKVATREAPFSLPLP